MAVTQYNSGEEIFDALSNHVCNKKYGKNNIIQADDIRNLMIGWVCTGCGEVFEVHIQDCTKGLDDNAKTTMSTSEGRSSINFSASNDDSIFEK